MKMKDKLKLKVLSLSLIGIGVILRIVYQIPNFSPIVGIALFTTAIFGFKKALYVSLISMLISDVVLGVQSQMGLITFMSFQPISYLTILGILFLSRALYSKEITMSKILILPVVSSTLFFIITNFVVWLDLYGWGMYTKDLQGLIQCYMMAIPFYRMSFLSDLIFSGSMFGAYYLVSTKVMRYKLEEIYGW